MIRPLTTYKSYVSDEVTTWMVDVYATGDAECLEPVGSDPSIQAGSAIGDRRVGAARLRTHNTSHITHKLAMIYR